MFRKLSFWRLALPVVVLLGLGLPPASRASPYNETADLARLADTQVTGTDFRISTMGPDGDTSYYALRPAVAYNSVDDEYLVVWGGDDSGSPDEMEIYGQRINAQTAALVGSRFQISDMGPSGNAAFGASRPDVAYNKDMGGYLVVWQGDNGINDELEIYGRRVNAAGALIDGSDRRFSTMGTDGDANFDAFTPAVVYNTTAAEYFIVWHGDDVIDNAVEIYGQRVTAASGAEVGVDDFEISDMGSNFSDTNYRAQNATVAHNSGSNEYLVVWAGDDDISPLVDGELEIFGQRLSAAGSAMGSNDFRISSMGPDGDPAYGAQAPSVAYNTTTQEYLVAWAGDDGGALADNELEIYAQRLSSSGVASGADDFRVSSMGPDGNVDYKAFGAAVAYSPAANEYLVTWRGDDNRNFGGGALADDAFEIFAQWLDSAGSEVGGDDLRISDVGNTDYDANFGADRPAVAISSADSTVLSVWQADDEIGTLVDDEVEILGRGFDNPRYVPVTFSLTPETSAANTAYAQQVYTLTLTNSTGQADVFDFSTSASDTSALPACGTPNLCDWQVSLSTAQVSLANGGSADVLVTVLIPAEEVKWVTQTLTVSAVAQNASATKSALITTSTGGSWNAGLSRWVGCRFDVEVVTSAGFIQSQDTGVLLSNMGSTTMLSLDYNHDGFVLIQDYSLMQSHSGENCDP